MAKTTASATVFVSYHQFGVSDGDYPTPILDRSRATEALVNPAEHGFIVKTGIHTGNVLVAVDVRPAAPVTVDLDGWEEITEISVDVADSLRVVALAADVNASLPILNPDGGPCRLRIHASGRDGNYDGVDEAPRETYLLVAWPAPRGQEVVHKRADFNW